MISSRQGRSTYRSDVTGVFCTMSVIFTFNFIIIFNISVISFLIFKFTLLVLFLWFSVSNPVSKSFQFFVEYCHTIFCFSSYTHIMLLPVFCLVGVQQAFCMHLSSAILPTATSVVYFITTDSPGCLCRIVRINLTLETSFLQNGKFYM